jgi:hypothetical protein
MTGLLLIYVRIASDASHPAMTEDVLIAAVATTCNFNAPIQLLLRVLPDCFAMARNYGGKNQQ